MELRTIVGIMLKIRNPRLGFTLIELVIIIVILGLLSIAVVPRHVSMQKNAEEQSARRRRTRSTPPHSKLPTYIPDLTTAAAADRPSVSNQPGLVFDYLIYVSIIALSLNSIADQLCWCIELLSVVR